MNKQHRPGPVASRQPPHNTPQLQASASPVQQNDRPAGRLSRQPTQRSPERASPRQQGQRSAEGPSTRFQSSRTPSRSSARPDQQSEVGSAVRRQRDVDSATRQRQPPGSERSSSEPLANQPRSATHTQQNQSSEQSTAVQHSPAHKRMVDAPASTCSTKRRKDSSPPRQSPSKTASRMTREQAGSLRRRGGVEATRERSGTSFVVTADVHVSNTDRLNDHGGKGDSQCSRCPADRGRQSGSTGNILSL